MPIINEDEELQKLSFTIEKYRELKNVPRKVLADSLGMTVSGYSKIERGEVDLSFKKILKIASILQVDYKELISVDVSKIFNISHNTTGYIEAKEVVVHNKLDEKILNYIALLEQKIKDLEN